MSVILYSQEIDRIGNDNSRIINNDINPDSLVNDISLETFAFNLQNLFKNIPFNDTLLNSSFPYFNPEDTMLSDIIDKGYLGSAVKILGKDYFDPGFNLGIHQYDLYKKKNEDFIFYKTNTPFASLFFSPGSNVQEFWTQAKFAKDFEDVNVALDYSRLISQGFYQGQNTKHSSLNFGVWKGDKESKFNTFFNFLVNIHQEEDNGGVLDTAFYKYSYNSIRENVPVKLNGSVTRQQEYSFTLNEFYKPGFELLGTKPYINAGFKGATGFYKFYDDNTGSIIDSLVYKSLLVDKIGLRNYISQSKYGVFGSLFFLTKHEDNIRFGLNYDYIDFNFEPVGDDFKNQLSFYSQGNFSFLDKKINISYNSKYYMLDYANDFLLNATFLYRNKYFDFSALAMIKNATPAVIFQNLYLTRQKVYTNDFDKILSNIYSAKIAIPRLGFSASFENKNYYNYIYFGSDLFPKQEPEKVVLNILNIKEEIRLWVINLDLYAHLYNSSSQNIPVPNYTFRSKLYLSPKLYKGNLFLKTGVEFNYWDKFYNYGYNPAIANYYVQNDIELDNYMRIDYFISAKIKSFLIFARANNLMSLWDNKVFYKSIDYPQNDFLFRVGVRWTLLN